MRAIATYYYPKKGGPRQRQFWHPTLAVDYFSASSQRADLVAYSLNRWIQDLAKVTLRDSKIRLSPVTVADVPDDHTRLIHCGYTPSQTYGGPHTDPVSPIVVRGKALPELEARPQWYAHLGRWEISFRSEHYERALTPAQDTQLQEWFGDQLLEAVDEELLDTLKARLRGQVKKSLEEYVAGLRRCCQEVEEAGTRLEP